MQKKQTYAELLKDPRWQKKRLEIMQRDNFTCQYCGATDKELQVHHLVYYENMCPWEYNGDELITLCKDCHRKAHENNVNDDKMPIVIGHVYEYEHGDFTNYMICLGTEISNGETMIHLFGIDNGAGYDSLYFYSLTEDAFNKRCTYLGEFFSEDYYKSYFEKSLMYVFFSFVNDTDDIYVSYIDICIDDKDSERIMKSVVRNNLHKILANNDKLRELYADALKNKDSVIFK